jgi:hypothetical protein
MFYNVTVGTGFTLWTNNIIGKMPMRQDHNFPLLGRFSKKFL